MACLQRTTTYFLFYLKYCIFSLKSIAFGGFISPILIGSYQQVTEVYSRFKLKNKTLGHDNCNMFAGHLNGHNAGNQK